MYKCKKCGEMQFKGQKCPCKKYKIINENNEECILYAYDEKDAALKYAEKMDAEWDLYLLEYPLGVTVNNKKFILRAEEEISYSATEVEI